MPDKIELLVPNFQTADFLERGIVRPLEKHFGNELRLTVIDDGSGPAEVHALHDILPRNSTLVIHTKRQGCAATFNHLLEIGIEPILFLANSDLIIPNIDQLYVLADALERAGPRSIIGTAEGPRFLDELARPYTLKPSPERRQLCPQDYVSACAMMLRKPASPSTMKFSTSFLNGYYEDCDLSYRLRSHGWQTFYADSLVAHVGNQAMLRLQMIDPGGPSRLNFLGTIAINSKKFTQRWGNFLNPKTDILETAIHNTIETNRKLIKWRDQCSRPSS